MPTLLTARDLTKAFPSSVLFEGVSIHVADGDRIGLIGPNGAGKSTLMKILAGIEPADEGEVVRRRGARLIYIEQDDRFEDGATPMSAMTAALEQEDARRGGAPDRGLDVATRASIMLSKIGFTDFDQPVATLSGGWKKRLSLACGLGHDPDALLLDEPTNHLDLEGVLWLEAFVKQAAPAMIFVTHDRRFLETCATRIIELSAAYPGGVFEVAGNYTEFVRRKEQFLDGQAQTESALANKVRRDTAWLLQGVKARRTRNKTQVDDATERRAELKATRDRNAAPTRTTTIDFQATERKTKRLLALHSVGKSMGGKPLFDGLDLTLTPGQRIGLLGVNGAGKTTLLRLMSGDLEPDTGTIKRADELRVVTFSQHRGTLVPTQTLQEALCAVGDTVDYRGRQVHVSGWAKRFLFTPDQLATQVGLLSGGEQARVLIANLMLEPADVLLLDEPTNDLDIPSLEVLEQALLEFPGALVLVTHDRFMLERIATEFVGLDGSGGIKAFASLDQWRRFYTEAEKSEKAAAAPSSPARAKRTPKPGKLSYKDQREYDGMEAAILEAEGEVERLEGESADPALATDHVRAAAVYESLTAAQTKVGALYARWAELEALRAGG